MQGGSADDADGDNDSGDTRSAMGPSRPSRLQRHRRPRHDSPVPSPNAGGVDTDDKLNRVFKKLRFLNSDGDGYFLILQLSELRANEPLAYDRVARHLNDLCEINLMVKDRERLSRSMIRICSDVITKIKDELRILETAVAFFNGKGQSDQTPLAIEEIIDFCKDSYFNLSQYVSSLN